MVQEGALTALASVADSSQELFQKYYDAVMPYLKTILINAIDKSNRMLRAKSMECISLVGMAVGKDKFRDNAKQVMEVLMSLQGSQMEADDPTTSYMLQMEGIKSLVWARFVESDGDLYVVLISSYENTCQVHIYKLVGDCSKIILVEELGDRVFFLTQQCSFSISARLLPHPWRQGNCVFFADYASSCCKCAIFVRSTHKYRHRVFHLGSQTFTRLWTPKGHSYSDLFNPPASFVVEEMTGEWEWMNKVPF